MKVLWFLLTISIVMAIIFGKAWDKGFENVDFLNQTNLKVLPEFNVRDLYSNKNINLQKVKFQNFEQVFIHFWATWCAPCEIELDHFMKFAERKTIDQKNIFIIVSVLDKKEDVLRRINKFGGMVDSKKIYFVDDEEGVMAKKFGSLKLPETYLFDKNQKLIRKYLGPQEWNSL